MHNKGIVQNRDPKQSPSTKMKDIRKHITTEYHRSLEVVKYIEKFIHNIECDDIYIKWIHTYIHSDLKLSKCINNFKETRTQRYVDAESAIYLSIYIT